MLEEDVQHHLAERFVRDLSLGESRQLLEHLRRVKPRMRHQSQRVKAVAGIGVPRRADQLDLELRAVHGLPKRPPHLVVFARRPLIAALLSKRGVAPDRDVHLALGVAESHAKELLAVAGGDFFFAGQQRKDVGLLAVGQIGQRQDQELLLVVVHVD